MARSPLVPFALLTAIVALAIGTGALVGRAGQARQAVPYSPTNNELPAAVLGSAPPPRGQAINYVSSDRQATGYLAIPAQPGPHPALILVHEWNGLNDRVRQVADAFAAEGYVALAADLFQGRTGSSPQENMALVRETQSNPARVVENLNAAARYLRGRPETTGKIAVMGWCFGGGIALSYGIEGDAHEGTAMFYGQLVQDPTRLAKITHPIYGSFAEEDQGIPPAEVEKFVAALRSAGIQNDVHIYDDMAHGFWLWVDQDLEARSGPALDAWNRLKSYLSRVLGN
jgi:carboxymethylenebutenolidase